MRFAAMANIFLLEDDKILSKGISIALKKDEHMVTAVYGYLEALKQYQKQKYDLFLLDINLPYENGYEVCRKIKQVMPVPIIFVTSRDTNADELKSIQVGGIDFITKPYDTLILLEKIKRALQLSNPNNFRELVKKVFLTSSQTRPVSLGSRLKGAAARCSARRARPSHVCEPSGIFSAVHAAGENN